MGVVRGVGLGVRSRGRLLRQFVRSEDGVGGSRRKHVTIIENGRLPNVLLQSSDCFFLFMFSRLDYAYACRLPDLQAGGEQVFASECQAAFSSVMA